ncbi:hypothetical protein M1L60_45295 [Actinoplanes sp. TRM 88003]|uniref:Uncharacterized protein n=1 Tax=Paractinoplanes aksuensis TaxID=2939490 RepID=A0ABT1E6N4_9ACTN|nr:hypothetical protein [Actinoplanes aksuensis]MCO8277810.1 hypothetical protein [Actinoplanes aksuensis]
MVVDDQLIGASPYRVVCSMTSDRRAAPVTRARAPVGSTVTPWNRSSVISTTATPGGVNGYGVSKF